MIPLFDLNGFHYYESQKKVDKFIEECYYNNHNSCIIMFSYTVDADTLEAWLRLNKLVREFRLLQKNKSYKVSLIKRKII